MKGSISFGAGLLGESDILSMAESARAAEELGYSTCWIAEDYFCGGAFSIAAACAESTRRIRIGIGVLNPFTRHPALIGMEAASLDALSGGRALMGLGASNALWIQEQMGIPFVKTIPSLRDCIQIMRLIFQGERFNYEGEVFHVRNIVPRTPRCPQLPVVLGAKSAAMLQLAGEQADGVLLSVGTSENYVHWAREQIALGAQKVGRTLDNFTVAAYLVFSIDQDRELARSRVKSRLAYYLGVHGDHPIMRLAGVEQDTIKAFREGFLSGQLRTDLVTEDIIDTFAIAGSPEECRERFRRFVAAGITHPVVFQLPEVPMKDTLRQVKDHLFDCI